MTRHLLSGLCLSAALLLPAWAADVSHRPEHFSGYRYAVSGGSVDVGAQPMAYPIAFIGSVMQHDRLLKKQLPKGVVFHPFRKGNDMIMQMGEGKLEAGVLGEMPVLNVLVRTPIVIVGLAKKNFLSVITRDNVTRFEQLRGKRIGYSPGSTSHYILLQGLSSAGMTEKDVQLVVMEPDAMPDALARKELDAFSAWEPIPSMALSQDRNNRAIYKTSSTSWFVMTREFAEQQPRQALQIVAAYVRAINWLRAGSRNAEQAAQWVLADSERLTGTKPLLSVAQIVNFLRRDLLDVPGAPVVLNLDDDALPLSGELAFLKSLGKVPSSTDEAVLRKAFAYRGLRDVLSASQHYRIYEYDYAD